MRTNSRPNHNSYCPLRVSGHFRDTKTSRVIPSGVQAKVHRVEEARHEAAMVICMITTSPGRGLIIKTQTEAREAEAVMGGSDAKPHSQLARASIVMMKLETS